MSGHDGTLYQITSLAVFCSGVPEENAGQLTVLLSELEAARTFDTYEGYLRYRKVLEDLLGISLKSREASDILAQYGGLGVIPEQAWLENNPEIEAWWNPVEVLEQVRIPVLAIFGDRDGNGDTLQGAFAWRKALEQAGNRNFRVELYPGVDHFMVASESSCRNDQEEMFSQVLQEQGYGPMEESLALFQREPGQHTPLSAWPYAPGYLDLIEEWLRGLPQ
jgi:hypothetical protein